MFLLYLPLGLSLPTLIGWLFLDLLEGNTHALWKLEKWILGFVTGTTFVMFCMFVAQIALSVPISLMGFLAVQSILLIILGLPWWLKKTPHTPSLSAPQFPRAPRWVQRILFGMGLWIALQILAFAFLLISTPSFFDDTLDNWNMRGKLFFYDHTLTLIFPGQTEVAGVSSYPPTVPLTKAWLSTVAGTWDEALVNSIHACWFFAAILLTFCILRRRLSREWSALGALMLAGLPLYLLQGMNAYADVFLSVHLLPAVGLLFLALHERAGGTARSFLRLSSFAIALVPFTKNEGWALYFPVLFLLWLGSLMFLTWKGKISRNDSVKTFIIGLGLMLLIIVPWISFKLVHSLAFGNGKGIDWNFHWESGVLLAIAVNTFFEANWIFLFPLFFFLLIARWKNALTAPTIVLTIFFLLPYCAQLFAYMFTGLSQEALFQTGYARGLIHMMPVVVILTTLLLHDLLYGAKGTKGAEGTNGY